MTRKLDSASGLLVIGVLMAALMVGAFAVADDFGIGLVCGGIILAYTLVVVLGRRHSGTLEALSGTGDERTASIYTRAGAYAGSILVAVIIGWWLVSIATGEENTTLPVLGAVFGLAFIVSCAVLQRRS